MNTLNIKLLDRPRKVVATARVRLEDGRFNGEIDLALMPAEMRRLFEEYEEIVSGQMFSFLDEIETRIEALRLIVAFEEGGDASLEDLQILPAEGCVSFKVANPVAIQR
jgi:hypothetical protein